MANKTALITGASSGIGFELARCFARDGHDVVLVSRSESDLKKIARDFELEFGVRATVIAKDLFEENSARQLYDDVRSRGIVVNYLVNDAGQGVYGKFAETDLEKELAIVHLNVCSLLVLTKLFLNDMLARNEGRILQLASVVSKTPAPYSAVYSGTKAFIYNFTQAVISELEGTNVTMTALRPGATATNFFDKAHMHEARIVREGKLGPADKVARDGYEALMRGDTTVISGLPNKIQDKVANVLPEKMVTKRAKKMHQPEEEEAE